MTPPDDPLAPPAGVFAEPWHANVLATAAVMVRSGQFSAGDWAAALGAELKRAEEASAPDTEATYFEAALAALEGLTEASGITAQDRDSRKSAWAEAYQRTPHGKPVTL